MKGDVVVHMAGFGNADDGGRPVTPQTPFFIGSVTKSFTALAVMQLVETGKVDLDSPAQRYNSLFQLADPDAPLPGSADETFALALLLVSAVLVG